MNALARNFPSAARTSARTTTSPDLPASPEWLAVACEKVSRLRHGVVLLVVHDGRVTQIERTEKTRLISS